MSRVNVGMVAGKGSSVALRALLALVLMVGFYALALAIAAGLLWICYAVVVYGERIPVKLILLCIVGALGILYSILPRIDKFIPPGPRLTPDEHPKLFKEIEQIAQATGQAMPAEVYLEADVNAWVTQRGGIMGIGSRRVMGLGLALMRVLNVSELRAVIAHEFGHFYGGDTKLGPWVYKTRGAIVRTVNHLGGSILQKPFLWYGKMFLRVTHAVSRRQEFTADRLAAGVVGSAPLINGLQKIHGASIAYDAFWRNELTPVLSAGYLPPIADGFGRFLKSSLIVSGLAKAVDHEMTEGKGDPYDTHPSLRQRVDALRALEGLGMAVDEHPAISLLGNIATLERQLLTQIATPDAVNKLSNTQWETTGTAVFLPLWQKVVREQSKILAGFLPEQLPETFVPAIKARGEAQLSDQLREQMLAISAALAVASVAAGAQLSCDVGEAVAVQRDGFRMEPFNAIRALADGRIEAGDWRTTCTGLGISGIDLSTVGG